MLPGRVMNGLLYVHNHQRDSLAGDLRSRGLTIPMTDILIAHLAKAKDLDVLSFDLNFDRVPGLRRRIPGD